MRSPLAIAMWDFSWLLRHHRLGEFENWDRVLDELADRGYNALRIDCFPHLVAAGASGLQEDRFFHPVSGWASISWGNQYSVYSRPRESLIAFLAKCRERRIRVGLATWFMAHGTKRNREIAGLDGFVRVWDETLGFIQENGLLEGVLYVDLLNEYPLWHGFEWLKTTLEAMGGAAPVKRGNGNANIPDIDDGPSKKRKYSPEQEAFYEDFLNEAIRQLRAKWPGLDFFASLTVDDQVPWQEMDISHFAALDAHIWFVYHEPFGTGTGYFSNIHKMESDLGFERTYRAMKEYLARSPPGDDRLAGPGDREAGGTCPATWDSLRQHGRLGTDQLDGASAARLGMDERSRGGGCRAGPQARIQIHLHLEFHPSPVQDPVE